MAEASQEFLEKVTAKWGNPKAVAKVAVNETYSHDLGFDHDDQVNRALEVGVLAGITKDETPEVFVERFEREILNED